jgi:hypothetical protein
LAASHVLVEVCAGLFFTLLGEATAWATQDLPDQESLSVSLSGARFLFGMLLSGLNLSAFAAAGIILVLVLLRSVLRRTWVADALFVVLLASLSLRSPATIPEAVLANVATIWILRRFGLLALAAMGCTAFLVQNLPLTVASWHAALSLTAPLILAAMAAWALYVILGSRPGAASRPASESRV